MILSLKRAIKNKPIFVALLWACWPASIFYLLVLQQASISRARVGLATLLIPVFGLMIYKIYPQIISFPLKTWFYIGFASAFIALMGKEVLLFYPQKTYLFDAKHVLEIKLLSFSNGQYFALNGFQTSLGDVSYSSFPHSADWKRVDNELIPVSIHPNPLIWTGWVGNNTRLDLQGSPGVVVQVIWDKEPQTIGFDQTPVAIPVETTFTTPVWGSILLFLVLWGSTAFIMTVTLVLIQKNMEIPRDGISWNRINFFFLPVAIFVMIGLILKIFLPINPSYAFPGRDSGVFLYIASHLFAGKLPYRDIWDHKGPMIYYIDALGLALGKGSDWGVWYIEIIFVLLSVVFLFILLNHITESLPAFIGCIIYLFGFGQDLSGGNFTEEYGLFFQILALIMFWYYLQKRRDGLLIVIGVLIAFLLLLRPNQIAVGMGIGLYILFQSLKNRLAWPSLRPLTLLGFGFMMPILFFGLFFALKGSLGNLISAVFEFNRIYIGSINMNILNDLQQGLYGFPSIGLWIVLGSTGVSILLIKEPRDSIQFGFLVITGVSFVVEIFLSNLSQAGFQHYYLTWLPYIAILSALAIRLMLTGIFMIFYKWKYMAHYVIYGIVILVSVAGSVRMFDGLRSGYYPLSWISGSPVWDTPRHPVNEIRKYLGKDSLLLMWGAETSINYAMRVDAPTKFVYQYPLMSADYATPAMVDEFTSDISASLPVIVDASIGDIGIIPLEKQRREAILNTPAGFEQYNHLKPFFNFFDAHYHFAGQLSYHDWLVYLPVH